jgi:hypothetical protein
MNEITSGNRLSPPRLVLGPAVITLGVTILRLVGERQGWSRTWFNPEAGGAMVDCGDYLAGSALWNLFRLETGGDRTGAQIARASGGAGIPRRRDNLRTLLRRIRLALAERLPGPPALLLGHFRPRRSGYSARLAITVQNHAGVRLHSANSRRGGNAFGFSRRLAHPLRRAASRHARRPGPLVEIPVARLLPSTNILGRVYDCCGDAVWIPRHSDGALVSTDECRSNLIPRPSPSRSFAAKGWTCRPNIGKTRWNGTRLLQNSATKLPVHSCIR